MKKIYLSLLLIFSVSVGMNSFAQDTYWARTDGLTTMEYSNSVVVDEDGASIISGVFRDSIRIGSFTETGFGNWDIFVAKLDAEGIPLWLNVAGSSADDFAYDVDVDSAGNVYICGKFKDTASFNELTVQSNESNTYDAFLAKLDAQGNWLWAASGGSSQHDSAEDLAVSPTGEIYVTGYYRLTAQFQGLELEAVGFSDAFIGKYTSDGSLDWIMSEGGTNFDAGWGIHCDDSGDIIVTGEFIGTADFSGIELSTGNSLDDMFLARYDSDGNIQWASHNSCLGYTAGFGLDSDADSDVVVVTGYYEDQTAFPDTTLSSNGRAAFLARYSFETGDMEWVRASRNNNFGVEGTYCRSVAYDVERDRIYMPMYSSFTIILPDGVNHNNLGSTFDGLLIAWDGSGEYLWSKAGVAPNWDVLQAVDLDSEGRITVSGGVTDAMIWEEDTLQAYGSNDIFVAKLSPCTFPSQNAFVEDVIACEGSESYLIEEIETGINYLIWDEDIALASGEAEMGSELLLQPESNLEYGEYSFELIADKDICAEGYVVDTIEITILENPEALWTDTQSNPLEISFNDESSIISSQIAGWQWDFGDGMTSSIQNPSHEFPTDDSYTVCLQVTAENGCSDTLCSAVEVMNTSIERPLEVMWKVFPNPASELVMISNLPPNARMEVYSSTGKILLSTRLNSYTQQLAVADWPRGIYLIQIETEEHISRKRLILR